MRRGVSAAILSPLKAPPLFKGKARGPRAGQRLAFLEVAPSLPCQCGRRGFLVDYAQARAYLSPRAANPAWRLRPGNATPACVTPTTGAGGCVSERGQSKTEGVPAAAASEAEPRTGYSGEGGLHPGQGNRFALRDTHKILGVFSLNGTND